MQRRDVVVLFRLATPALLAACGSSPGAATGRSLDGSSDAPIAVGPSHDAAATPDDAGGLVEDTDASLDAGPACVPLPSIDASVAVATAGMTNLIPLPTTVTPSGGAFVLPSTATIRVAPASAEMLAIGNYLAAKLRPSTGYALPVAGGSPCAGDVALTTNGDPTLANEGYALTIDANGATVSAYQPAGVFHGLQTLRQLFPPTIESATQSPGPWALATGTIRDVPRFPWRGTMLDVARHFFGVTDVETYIDLLAYYKINTFHIHLTDDQGWRIYINSWPNLATYGGSTEVDGGPGGYYTQAQFSSIVQYANDRYITIVPEIDMPGHTEAALASYADLDCDGGAPPLDTSTAVGISSLCVSDSETYTFASDVIGEVAALAPGAYFHVGGDEASATSASDFQTFFTQVMPFVKNAGKQVIGWDAVGQLSNLPPGAVVQYWASGDSAFVTNALGQSAKVLMSPASLAYMDMKYDSSTTLGQNWAGYIDEQTAYSWDPATVLSGVGDAQLVGLEAPLWSETLLTLADIEYMAFPRIAGYAEIGWSPSTGRSWDEYKVRLGSEGPRLRAMGVNYYSSSAVPWQ
jgi:hexosaminidase